MVGNERGASLIELTLVMGLVGLLAVLAGESFVAAASRHQGQAAATELAAELRAARHLALVRRERVRVVFEPEQMRVRTEPADRPTETLRRYDYHSKGIAIERLSNGPSLIFYPSGRSATPATIIFRNNQAERWQITVSLTGRVSLL